MVKALTFFNYILILTVGLMSSGAARAQWTLDNSESVISFVSVKNAAVAETHRFTELNGAINEAGHARIAIELDSVDTRIQIRDERMRRMLFESGLYPRAFINASIDVNALKAMKPGDSFLSPLTFELDLHGKKKKLTTRVTVIALNEKRLFVSTIAPVIINLADHNLVEGINQLREIAKLSSINTSVAVSAQLVFSR